MKNRPLHRKGLVCRKAVRKSQTTSSLWTMLGWSGGGGGGEGGGTSYIRHSTDVRAEMAPFSSAAKYMIRSFFQAKVYDWFHFSGLVYERPHFSDVFPYMHISFVQKFSEAACSLGIQGIDCDICLTTSNKMVQKKFKGQYMNGSIFQTI